MVQEPRLLLTPASERGWFGGKTLLAETPVRSWPGVSLARAAELLETAYRGESGPVAVLARYDGTCSAVRFEVLRETAPLEPGRPAKPLGPLLADAAWDLSGRRFRAAIRETQERIARGDVYVLNLTARLTGCPVLAPSEAFSALRSRASADMAALLEGWPGETAWLASVSPERFVRVTRGEHGARVVEVCPIKGTRPRGATPEADAALAVQLAADDKECAEHVMIVDLERNDLGMACTTGTVRVDPLYEVIQTPYCHQMVSTVRGTLRSDATFAELLDATFPCGSVTGAPKQAAMRIIEELEASARGAYCGALIVAMHDELDSSVLIRTLESTAEQPGHATWGAGCGITFDSDPAAEHLEMLLKASPVVGDTLPEVALRETMRVAFGRVPLFDRHLARLGSGGAGPSARAEVRRAVESVLAEVDVDAPYARLGVTLTPDGAVAAGISTEPSSLDVSGGPVLVPVEIERLPELPPAAAKPAARKFWDRPHHAAELAGGHQALVHTADGTVIDGSTATVWAVLDGVLVTPPAPPAVAGVMREVVFDLAAQLGIAVHERRLTLTEVLAAEEIALSNAVGGFVPARDRSGHVTERIAQGVSAIFER